MKKTLKIVSLLCVIALFCVFLISACNFLSGYGGMRHRIVEDPNVPGKTCEVSHIYDKETKRIRIPRKMFGYKVIGIGNGTFAGCNNLTDVKVRNGIRYIGSMGFAHCEKLTTVKLPTSVTELQNHAFYKCPSLTRSVSTMPSFSKSVLPSFSPHTFIATTAMSSCTKTLGLTRTGFSSPPSNRSPPARETTV